MAEKVEVDSSIHHLLDTDIDTGVWALGITDKAVSTDVVGGSSIGPENLDCESEGVSPDDVTKQAERKQFDFIHIRYRGYALAGNEESVFRRAFAQTKPGGWIEVVGSDQSGLDPIRAAGSIKRQLEVAGFTEIEEKRVWRRSTSGPLQKLGRFLSGVFSMNWVLSGDIAISMRGAGCGGGSAPSVSPGVFVIARRPRY